MTTFTAMDINTFCALPIHIETITDSDGTQWYILDEQLRALIAGSENFAEHEHVDPSACTDALLEKDPGKDRNFELIGEPSLYLGLLMSEAQVVQPFKSWVFETVAPTLAEDGLFTLGEEYYWPTPSGYSLTNEDILSGDLDDPGNAIELAEQFLPDLRETGMTDRGVIRVNDGKPEVDEDAFALAIGKKMVRKAAACAKA